MKYVVAVIMILGGAVQCASNAMAYGTDNVPKMRSCKQIRGILLKIAHDDADSFDMDNLKETGVIKYMCANGITTDMHGAMCDQAKARGCK